MPLRVKIPVSFCFESVEEAITAIGGDEPAEAVCDADDAIVDPGVVAREFEREGAVIKAGSKFGGEVVLGVDIRRSVGVEPVKGELAAGKVIEVGGAEGLGGATEEGPVVVDLVLAA